MNMPSFITEHHFNQYQIVNSEYATPAFLSLLKNPEKLFSHENAVILKESSLCTLVSLTVDGKKVVVKKFRWREGKRGLTRLFRPTRAARCWRFGNLLLEHGVLTPKPVALIEKRLGFLRLDSYLITEYCHGYEMKKYVEEQNDPLILKNLEQEWETIHAKMTAAGVSHGDIHLRNFMITEKGLMIFDLDTMRYHHFSYRLAHRKKRDYNRFIREWEKARTINKS